MYGKVFESIFEGSMYGHWEAIVTFMAMIVLADKDGDLNYTLEALSGRTSIPIDILKRGIDVLEAPDPQSKIKVQEGRRLVRLSDSRDWGWNIVNHAIYRAMRTADERREYFKRHKREQRARAKNGDDDSPPDDGADETAGQQSPPLSTESPLSPPIAEANAEADALLLLKGDHRKSPMVRLILAANLALQNHVDARYRFISGARFGVHQSTSADAARLLEDAGVPIDDAERLMGDVARTAKPSGGKKPPSALSYYVPAIITRYSEERARADMRAAGKTTDAAPREGKKSRGKYAGAKLRVARDRE